MRPIAPLAVALLALAVLAACRPAPPSDVRVGGTIPEFELVALDGRTVSSRSFRGGPVVLNFWATWCRPCIKEVPTLNAIAEGAAAQVVTIALDEEGESVVRPFVERHGVGYTVLLGDKELFQRFGGWAIPYTLVLDPSLRIVGLHRGYVNLRSLERDLRRAAPAPRTQACGSDPWHSSAPRARAFGLDPWPGPSFPGVCPSSRTDSWS